MNIKFQKRNSVLLANLPWLIHIRMLLIWKINEEERIYDDQYFTHSSLCRSAEIIFRSWYLAILLLQKMNIIPGVIRGFFWVLRVREQGPFPDPLMNNDVYTSKRRITNDNGKKTKRWSLIDQKNDVFIQNGITGVQYLIKTHAPLLHVLPRIWRQKCTITNMLLKSSNVTGERNWIVNWRRWPDIIPFLWPENREAG